MKHVLGALMLGLLAGCGSGGGGSPSVGPTPVQAQTVQYVTVTNDPLRVDLINGTIPVNVTVTVDPNALTQSKKVIGLNLTCVTTTSDPGVVTAYTVPPGKIFVLTDAVGHGVISRQIGSASSEILQLNGTLLSFASGFDFPSSSQVVAKIDSGNFPACISISGYLVTAQ